MPFGSYDPSEDEGRAAAYGEDGDPAGDDGRPMFGFIRMSDDASDAAEPDGFGPLPEDDGRAQ